MNVAQYDGMVKEGKRLSGRFCDCETMGFIFQDVVAQLVGCLKFGQFKLV
jgi:hypothetical protein